MDDKYYVPGIEDFRIGFEYEYESSGGKWVHKTMDAEDLADTVVFYEEHVQHRVPYLTHEQIIAEEWTNFIEVSDDRFIKAKADTPHSYSLTYRADEHFLSISDVHFSVKTGRRTLDYSIYTGTCRCINDFRLICKMVGIHN